MAEKQFLALDLGAESGRGELVKLSGGKVTMQEIHRWPNRPVRLGSTLYWDFPFLFAEILETLKRCAHDGLKLDAVSVDTWGVDFGLLAGDGSLLSNPVHYRDARTEGIHDYANPTMTREEIFALTAYDPWAISSLYQLLAMQRAGSPLLEQAETLLHMPDLFGYFLTGVRRSEASIANTSNLLATDGAWCSEIIKRFSLPARMFQPLAAPPAVLGPLRGEVCDQTALGELPVISTCGHDTSAVAAAVPAVGDRWAFLSCGTWSILGAPLAEPIPTVEAMRAGVSNQVTIGGWYLAGNILGLWLVQQLRLKWNTPSDRWSYERMTAEAEAADPTDAVFDATDTSLLAPADMEQAVLALLRQGGAGQPESHGQLVRTVLQCLALEYARRLQVMAQLIGRPFEALYMVGGGIANTLLCQLTADACGLPVYAGPAQCTAVGNALAQALALGVLKDRQEIRQVMRDSFPQTHYEPQDDARWGDLRRRYADLVGQ